MMWKTEGSDPLNFWGLMHFGMASNMEAGQSRTRSGPQISTFVLVLVLFCFFGLLLLPDFFSHYED